MDEIKILIDDDVNSNKSDSKDTPRKEQPWESRSEVYIYLRKIMNACNDISKEHDTEAKQYRLRYKILVIPTIVLPVLNVIFIR